MPNKTHLRVFGCCVSFVAACTLKWCYDSKPSLWNSDYTDDEKNVTCKKCIKRIKEWEKMDIPDIEIPFLDWYL